MKRFLLWYLSSSPLSRDSSDDTESSLTRSPSCEDKIRQSLSIESDVVTWFSRSLSSFSSCNVCVCVCVCACVMNGLDSSVYELDHMLWIIMLHGCWSQDDCKDYYCVSAICGGSFKFCRATSRKVQEWAEINLIEASIKYGTLSYHTSMSRFCCSDEGWVDETGTRDAAGRVVVEELLVSFVSICRCLRIQII